MRSTKLLSLLLAGALSVGALAGCSQSQDASDSSSAQPTSNQAETTQANGVEAEAQQLLVGLTGSYQELFPVLFESQYEQLWIDDAVETVGEADAETAVGTLQASITGTMSGEEAVETYGEEGGPFDCSWKEGLVKLTVDGDDGIISGTDAQGNVLFEGTYSFMGMDGNFFVFESDDVDNADFKYFAFLPDTADSTYHIEFRYGAEAEGIGEMMEGPYAYWNAAGIQTDYTQKTIEDVIKLFCDENLAE